MQGITNLDILGPFPLIITRQSDTRAPIPSTAHSQNRLDVVKTHMTETAIQIENLVKVYKEKSSHPVRALDGLDLRVKSGEIFGLLGRNGAGKTTLLRVLTTLIHPTSGKATLLGLDINRDALQVRERICVVLQENAVELFLSVWDNFVTYARFHSVPSNEIPRRAEHVIEQFGLSEYVNQKVIDLSGGLKRRVQVAKVFMVDKPIVFLDEATTGMDPINKRGTINAIRDQAKRGRTIFLTTHILEEAEELCDTVAIIDHGKCVASGDLPTIKSLVSNAFDIVLAFETPTDEVMRKLQELPLLSFSFKNNTAELRVRGEELFVLDIISKIVRNNTLLHIEVNSSSLEDAFIELLDRREVRHDDAKSGMGRST